VTTIRLDDLHGRKLRDSNGKVVGRIYDVRAEEQGGELVIVEYHVGAGALWTRLGFAALHLVGLARRNPRIIPWDQVDISDPFHPVLVS
jgi:sporulation protein YlmC with PRC-barrel domain